MAKSTSFFKTLLTLLFLGALFINQSSAQGISLDQYANGKIASLGATAGPGAWQNGNLNPNNCHLAESYSVPYRAIITGLSDGAAYTLRIGIDVKESGKMALDYFTGYQNLTPHNMFSHDPELVNPLEGITTTGWQDRIDFEIPAPVYLNPAVAGQPTTSFNLLKETADGINGEPKKGYMSFYNATPTAVYYDPDVIVNLGPAFSTVEGVLIIRFIAEGTSAVIAWGGHIADQDDWGELATPSNINGSPYHCRIKNLRLGGPTGDIVAQGSTDRSLKASAVYRPPTCLLDGNKTACQGDASITHTYTGGTTNITSFTWSLSGAYTGKYKIDGAGADGTLTGTGVPNTVTIVPVNTSGGLQAGSYTINLSVTSLGGTMTCSATGLVNPDPDADAGTDPAAQCSAATNTFTVSGTATNGTALWTVQSKPAAFTVSITSPTSASTTVVVTPSPAGAGGTVVLRLTVTSSYTDPSCGSDYDDVNLVINEEPAAPNVTYDAPECDESTFSVTVTNPVVGYTYTLTQDAGGATPLPVVYASGTLTFSNLVPGKGFSVTAKTPQNCESDATDCDNYNTPVTTQAEIPEEQQVQRVQDVDARIISKGLTRVLANPNPFTDKVRFTLQSDVSGQGSLEIFNTMGQKIATVYQGYVEAGRVLNKEYNVERSFRSNLIYVFRVGDQKTTGKLLNW